MGGMGSGRMSADEAMACQHDPGRGPPSPCKFFILDVSDMAREMGLPVCSEVDSPQPPASFKTNNLQCGCMQPLIPLDTLSYNPAPQSIAQDSAGLRGHCGRENGKM